MSASTHDRSDCGLPATLNETLERITIRSLEDIRAAAQSMNDAVRVMANLRTAPCANIASKDPMVDSEGRILAEEVFGWSEPDERWWEKPLLALTSPLTLACRYESEPFWCNSSGIHTRQLNPHLLALNLAEFFEFDRGGSRIVVPIHLPFGQIAAVSFQSIESNHTDLALEYSRYADLLDMFSRRFICGYVKVMDKQQWIPPDVILSKREIECLRWAAVGKTDNEIGTILSRSSATIRFHIHNAALKLNAVNRSQTVFKAGQLGYLGAVN